MKIKVEIKICDDLWYCFKHGRKSCIIKITDEVGMYDRHLVHLVEQETGKLFAKLQKELKDEENKKKEENIIPERTGCDPEEKTEGENKS